MAIRFCVRLIQKRHTIHAPFARFQSQCGELLPGQTVIQKLRKRRLHKNINGFVFIAQHMGVFLICSQSFESIGDELPQTANIFVLRG